MQQLEETLFFFQAHMGNLQARKTSYTSKQLMGQTQQHIGNK